jgi:predicted ATPase/Tfp pilus assembly protein PilF
MLWPDADPAAARDRLSQALVWLRRHLEPDGVPRGSVLVTDRLTVQLPPTHITTDVADFEAALAAARKAETPSARKAAFARAVEAYRGELLPGHYADWVLTERRRLLEEFLFAVQEAVRLYEENSGTEKALDFARRAVTADPLREEAHTELIRLLIETGQNVAALRQYQELEARLARDLGVLPSPATQALIAPLRPNVVPPSPAPLAPAAATLPFPPRPVPLPTPLTRLFGRDTEIARVREMVLSEGARLVTLIGIGGAGKTRLGVAVARTLMESYGGAVAFIPLADLDDARLIPAALAAALHLPGSSTVSPWESIIETLSARPFLLVLDNLEHLRADAPPLIRELLERAPMLTILTTSRQRLGLEGEQEVTVAPLPLPAPDTPPEEIAAFASVQLFVDRARAVRPDFALTPANAAAVARVCARLDGIPLAVELCAAWAAMLTPEQMLEHLDRRFDLLVSRRADITPRHRTLRAALEYSYLQLPPDLQALFARLSVFRGGWTLDATGAVGTDSEKADSLLLLAGLTELRERSLILAEEVREDDSGGAEMRYRMLETLREFAGEQLAYAERAARRQAHAVYFLNMVEQAEAGMDGTEQERWLRRLDRELENLRAALAWSLETGETEFGLRLGGALGRYWSLRGPLREGYEWLRKLLDRLAADREEGKPAPPVLVHAKAESAMGHLAWAQGDYSVARATHEQAMALRRDAGDESGVAESLYHLGITAYRQGDFTAAREFLEESLTLAQKLNDRAGIARAVLNLGNIAYEEQRYEEARPLFQQSLDLARELGNRQRAANALNNLGLLFVEAGDYPRATALFEEALSLYRETTDQYNTAIALANLGRAARLAGQDARARQLLTDGARLAYEIGNKHILVHQLLQLGVLDVNEGMTERGALLIGASRHLFEVISGAEGPTTVTEYYDAAAAARATLGDAEFEAIRSRANNLPLGQVIAEAIAPPALTEQDSVQNS